MLGLGGVQYVPGSYAVLELKEVLVSLEQWVSMFKDKAGEAA